MIIDIVFLIRLNMFLRILEFFINILKKIYYIKVFMYKWYVI